MASPSASVALSGMFTGKPSRVAASATGVITGACVLGWTWTIAEHVRRLIEPAATREPPNPQRVAMAWLPPLALIAVAGGVVAGLGEQASNSSVDSVSSLPLLGAVAALLLAIPLTYRPLFLLAGLFLPLYPLSIGVNLLLGAIGFGVWWLLKKRNKPAAADAESRVLPDRPDRTGEQYQGSFGKRLLRVGSDQLSNARNVPGVFGAGGCC